MYPVRNSRVQNWTIGLEGMGDMLDGCCPGCDSGNGMGDYVDGYMGDMLDGLGINLPVPTTTSPTGTTPWWQRAIEEIQKIVPRITQAPVYTSPTFPPSVNQGQVVVPSSYGMPSTMPDWLPWALGAAVLIAMNRRK